MFFSLKNTLFLIVCIFTVFLLPTSAAVGDSYSEDGFLVLGQDDLVGISFWIATAAMLASSLFFLIERANVAPQWKTSMTIATLITGIAFCITCI